jgi:hypothetical protein
MQAAMNHVYPIRQSCYSRTSITIHACTTFPIEDGAFSTTFFTSAWRRAKMLLLTGVPIALSTRSIRNSLTSFSPAARGSCLFLLTDSPLHCRCNLGFLDTCGTITIIICYRKFLDTWMPHVHFVSIDDDEHPPRMHCGGSPSILWQGRGLTVMGAALSHRVGGPNRLDGPPGACGPPRKWSTALQSSRSIVWTKSENCSAMTSDP